MDGTLKCIEDEIPFDVPEGWAWARMVSFSSLITDGEHKTPQRVNEFQGYYLLSARNIQNGFLSLNDVDFVEKSEFDKISKRCNPKENDVLISCSGSIGRVTVVNDRNAYVMVRSAAMVRTININPYYLMFALQSGQLQNQMQKASKQTAQANLFLSAIQSLLIPIPPEFEAQRITQIAEQAISIISMIEKNQECVSQNILQAKAKILDLAIRGQLVSQDPNDEPASILLERIRSEKEELIKQGKIKRDKKESIIFKGDDNSYYEKLSDGKCRCIDEEIPFVLPDGWEWCNLSMIGTTNIGLTYRPVDIETDGTVVLRSSNIINDEIDLNDLVRVKTTIRDNQYVQSNDILICTRNGSKALVGKCALICDLKEPASFGAFMAVYRTPYYQYVLHYLRSSLFRGIFDDTNSTAINQLTQDMLKRAIIPLPPQAEQERIVSRLDCLLSQLRDIEKSLN